MAQFYRQITGISFTPLAFVFFAEKRERNKGDRHWRNKEEREVTDTGRTKRERNKGDRY